MCINEHMFVGMSVGGFIGRKIARCMWFANNIIEIGYLSIVICFFFLLMAKCILFIVLINIGPLLIEKKENKKQFFSKKGVLSVHFLCLSVSLCVCLSVCLISL